MGADAPTSNLDLWSSEVLCEPWEHFREIRDAAERGRILACRSSRWGGRASPLATRRRLRW